MPETQKVTNLLITGMALCDPPSLIKAELPVSQWAQEQILANRIRLKRIIAGEEKSFLLVAGPCSIHEPGLVQEFGGKLAKLTSRGLHPDLFLLMRACFEKPRSVSRPRDWPGLIMDPHLALDGTHDFNTGIRRARKIALGLVNAGIPLATEILDPDLLQYFDDVLTMFWVGARTVQVPELRRVASGASMPVGFKNPTDGKIGSAIDAVESASHPNFFSGIDAETGRKATFDSAGNPSAFVILRGSDSGPNYDDQTVRETLGVLSRRGLSPFVLTDCSHGNSGKDPERQPEVFAAVVAQYRAGLRVGAMLESYLEEGRQEVLGPEGQRNVLRPGVSITDACTSWKTLQGLVKNAPWRLA